MIRAILILTSLFLMGFTYGLATQRLEGQMAAPAAAMSIEVEPNQGETQPLAGTLPYYRDATFTPIWDASAVRQVARFSLVDQNGARVTERDLDGHISVVSFFFASCNGICPRTVARLAEVQRTFRHDPQVMIFSHSVTPKDDTVAVLAAYAKAHGVVAEKWRLLTGDEKVIDALCRDSYFSAPAGAALGGTRQALHSENVLLIDRNRRVRGLYHGTMEIDIGRLTTDIRKLEREQ